MSPEIKTFQRHPVSEAFDDFQRRRPMMFDSVAHGRFLENRLRVAFEEGWLECERRVKAALNGEREP